MAFDEDLIDFMNGLPAGAGRTAGAQRRAELRRFFLLPPEPPAGETPGLARQIIERQLEGLEPARDALGIHKPSRGEAAAAGGDDGHRSSTRESGPKKWMRGGSFMYFTRGSRSSGKSFRGSQSWKEGREGPLPFAITCPLGMGRDGASVTTNPRAAMTIRRRTADSAGRSTRSTALWRDSGIRETVSPQQAPAG